MSAVEPLPASGIEQRVREFFFRRAMTLAMAKRAPDRIPMSGERLMQRDYFSVTLSNLSEGEVLIDKFDGDAVVGRAWVTLPERGEQGEYATEVRIPVSRAAVAKAQYTYYLRQYEFNENNAVTFWLRLIGGDYRVHAWTEDVRQGRYNRQRLARKQRMDLLQWLIDESVAAWRDEASGYRSATEFLTQQHTRRWFRHPAALDRLHYTTLQLESLRAQGLVKRDDFRRYQACPIALAELDKYNTEERRHKASQSLQWAVMVIGGVALIASIAQAAADIKQAWFSESATSDRPTPGASQRTTSARADHRTPSTEPNR
ncbi:hypothetical protein [Burkholderia multivorans]|uniref:hypothetical protein n=1 Tax=Burkholderia multivorans TaxID=87883 RepID=UPI003736A562